MPARYVPVAAVRPVMVTMMSQRPQNISAIGVIGVRPCSANWATRAGGMAMLNAQEQKIQKAPTMNSATTVATGTSDRGVLVSSATVLMTSNPVKDRMPKRTPWKIAFHPPVAAAGLNGAAVTCPSDPRTTKMVRVNAKMVAISKAMTSSAVLADTLMLR